MKTSITFKLVFILVMFIGSISSTHSQSDPSNLIIKDARGLGISPQDIGRAAEAKSEDYLVIFAFASLSDSLYVDLVSDVASEQHINGNKKIYVLFYNTSDTWEEGMTQLFFKGKSSLPVMHQADQSGAALSTLIRRVYNDHYK